MRVFLLLLIFFQTSAYAQDFSISIKGSPEEFLSYLLDTNYIRINNVKYRGRNTALGKFSFKNSSFEIKKGVVLSTGEVSNITGGNKTPGTSGLAWDNEYRYKIDKDLKKLSKGKVCDQAILEFDFIPLENELSFNFIFASEEYKEYVGSRFNDVFGFFVTGDSNFHKNIAVVPELLIPVSVNNVNHYKNSNLYINNSCFENSNIRKLIDDSKPREPFIKEIIIKLFGEQNKEFTINEDERKKLDDQLFNNFEFDGLTTKLKAVCYLTPYQVYHMKIAIGDVGDPMFDSGVFIEQNSIKTKKNKDAPYFKEYENLRGIINIDSLFNIKEVTPIIVVDSPPSIEEEFEITNINFDYNDTLVSDTSQLKIKSLANYLKKHSSLRVQLIGYTDNIGTMEYNQALSTKRAESVKTILTLQGVPSYRIAYIGNNYLNPLADNDSEKGRSINRRVEIYVIE